MNWQEQEAMLGRQPWPETPKVPDLIPLGTQTVLGKVAAIHSSHGERSYFLVRADGSVSRWDEDTVRDALLPDVSFREWMEEE